MPEILDDKSEHCIPFLLDRLAQHRDQYVSQGEEVPPFFLGLNGVQGAGKTTLVSTLSQTLSSPPHNLPTVVLSIDDLYLPHSEQKALAESHPDNPLVQHRGVPPTHDIQTGVRLFEALASRKADIRIPSYDKSRFDGAGDRRAESEWDSVNVQGQKSIEVIIFEGWCVGFRALSDADLESRWKAARVQALDPDAVYNGQLGKLRFEDVQLVNSKLRDYDALTDRLGALIHIDAEDTQFVYDWRQEQEAAMRAAKGTGMTEEQVVTFVNGYYPAYELYTGELRKGMYGDEKGRQLRLIVGRDRRVQEARRI